MLFSIILNPGEAYQTYHIDSLKGFTIQSGKPISKDDTNALTKILTVWKELEIAQELEANKGNLENRVFVDRERGGAIRLAEAQRQYYQTLATYRVVYIRDFL